MTEQLRPVNRAATSCQNCDGVKCMGCVFREYDHTCRDDCPFCCSPGQADTEDEVGVQARCPDGPWHD